MSKQHGGHQADEKHHGGNQPGEAHPHGKPKAPPINGSDESPATAETPEAEDESQRDDE